MNRLLKPITGLLVLVMLFNSVGIALAQGPVTASSGPVGPPGKGQVVLIPEDSLSRVRDLVARVQPFIEVNQDGSVDFTAPDAATLGIDERSYAIIKDFIEGINQDEIGITTVDEDGRLRTVGRAIDLEELENLARQTESLARASGAALEQPNFYWSWYGGLYVSLSGWETWLLKWGVTDALFGAIGAVIGSILGNSWVGAIIGWVVGHLVDELVDQYWPDRIDFFSPSWSLWPYLGWHLLQARPWRSGYWYSGQWYNVWHYGWPY